HSPTDLCEEATCPICLEYFRDPVIIPECGHNFCRACLIQCWGESEGEASCPQCREILQHRNLIPNRPLANVVEKLTVGKLRLHEEKGAEGKGRVCGKHQEPLKLFCKEDESPICLVCNVSKEHKSHEVIPLEEASQEYKVGKHSGSVAEHSLLQLPVKAPRTGKWGKAGGRNEGEPPEGPGNVGQGASI
uniref:RING-type E3 ubiquitin transferase n=1 Tax=Podarcis muralis TaxID=64176 RepID=A0A670HZV5_PODMU